MFICRRNTLPVSKAQGLGWATESAPFKTKTEIKGSDDRRYYGTQEQPQDKWRVQSRCPPPLLREVILAPARAFPQDQLFIVRRAHTLSLSVEPARRDTGFCCPHFQPLISGASSPCS